jgi:uncharacterized lipoprotein YbaY
MKNSFLLSGCAALAVLFSAGCGHMALDTEADPHRVLVGTVQFSDPIVLPSDAQVRVSVVDENPPPPAANPGDNLNAMPALNRANSPALAPGPEVLGETTIQNPGPTPVAFRVEYVADDDRLRRGLAIQVRVSYGGTVRFFNAMQYEVNLSDASELHQVSVEPAR